MLNLALDDAPPPAIGAGTERRAGRSGSPANARAVVVDNWLFTPGV
jgi:hypothetical protein